MSPPDKSAIRQAFERAATTYDVAAFMQREVGARLAERLDYMKIDPLAVLDAGTGTGEALADLRRRFPVARLHALDLAHGMLGVARQRCADTGLFARLGALLGAKGRTTAIDWVCADIDRLPYASGSMDLVWSNLTLQWLGDLDQAFRELRRVLRPGGLLLFSTFGPDTLKELRQAFAGIDGHAHVNGFMDMHDIGDKLPGAGFVNPVMEMDTLTLTYADLRGLLAELKAIGAHTVTDNRRPGLMGRQQWRAFEENYARLRDAQGRYPATYEIVYGHAWVGQSARAPGGRGVIPIRSMPGAGR
jgi:malonyl-CoA O-methyltransferase